MLKRSLIKLKTYGTLSEPEKEKKMNSKKTLRNKQIGDLVFASIISLIIIIMTFVPSLGYIPIGPVAITIIHIPVLIGAIILGRKYGMLFGLIFGLGSMIRSFMEYTLYAPFTNPLVSVLPRIVFGFVIYDIFRLFLNTLKKEALAVPLTMVTATLIHSLIVLPLLFLAMKTGFYFFSNEVIFNLNENLFKFIWGIFIANSIFEIALATIIGSAVTIPLLILKKANYD